MAKPADGQIVIWAASVEHRHGTNLYLGLSEAEVMDGVASFVAEWWEQEIPDTPFPGGATDAERIAQYFEAVEDEYANGPTSEAVHCAPLSDAIRRIHRAENTIKDAINGVWDGNADGWEACRASLQQARAALLSLGRGHSTA